MLETMYDLEFEDANRTIWFLVRQVNNFMSRALWHSLRKHRVNPEQLIILWGAGMCEGGVIKDGTQILRRDRSCPLPLSGVWGRPARNPLVLRGAQGL